MVILIIAGRELFHELFRVVPIFDASTNDQRHDAVKLIESYTAFYNLMILFLLAIIYRTAANNLHLKWFISTGMIYCGLLSLICLFPFLSPAWQILLGRFVMNTFAQVFIIVLFSLTLYYFICIRKKWIF